MSTRINDPSSLEVVIDPNQGSTTLHNPQNGASHFTCPLRSAGHTQEIKVPYAVPGTVSPTREDADLRQSHLLVQRFTRYFDSAPSQHEIDYRLRDPLTCKTVTRADLDPGTRVQLDEIATQLLDNPNAALRGPLLYDVMQATPQATVQQGGPALLEAAMRGYVMMMPRALPGQAAYALPAHS